MAAKLLICGLGLLLLGGARAADVSDYVVSDGFNAATSPPFSNAVMAAGAYYLAGTIGVDPSAGATPANTDSEAHAMLDSVKKTLAKRGMVMDDLVSVTVYCTDLTLYDQFNSIYRGYFSGHFPARAFIGVNQLVRGAHFEIAGVAVKHPTQHKPS